MVKFFIGSDFKLKKAAVKIRPAWRIVISKNADFFSKYPCVDYAQYVTDCFTGSTKTLSLRHGRKDNAWDTGYAHLTAYA